MVIDPESHLPLIEMWRHFHIAYLAVPAESVAVRLDDIRVCARLT